MALPKDVRASPILDPVGAPASAQASITSPAGGFDRYTGGSVQATMLSYPLVTDFVWWTLPSLTARLRSQVSEDTGSLLDAVDAIAVEAGVSIAFPHYHQIARRDLTPFRELTTPSLGAPSVSYYAAPRQNMVFEAQVEGSTILSRVRSWRPPRLIATIASLGITPLYGDRGDSATPQQIITYLLEQWAEQVPWLEFAPVPDLRLFQEGWPPYAYGMIQDNPETAVFAPTVRIEQSDRTPITAMDVLQDALSPFPGSVIRQDSLGRLSIVVPYGPDADEVPSVRLSNVGVYSISRGRPDVRNVINRATATAIGDEFTDEAVMQPAWFQIGPQREFGRTGRWYEPPTDRLNLQPPIDGPILQEHDLDRLDPSATFHPDVWRVQAPDAWPLADDKTPAGDGISLVDDEDNRLIQIGWTARRQNGDVFDSGTDGVVEYPDLVPFDGTPVLLRWRKDATIFFGVPFPTEPYADTAYLSIYLRWANGRIRIENPAPALRLFTHYEAGAILTPGIRWVVEFTLEDFSEAYAGTTERSGSFGYTADGNQQQNPILGPDGQNAVQESQLELGVLEDTIRIRGYALDSSALARVARSIVAQRIQPRVTREVELSAAGITSAAFDNLGRTAQLPSGERGNLVGVQYQDDFPNRTWAKSVLVEVPDPLGPGAVSGVTWLLNDDQTVWMNDDGSLEGVEPPPPQEDDEQPGDPDPGDPDPGDPVDDDPDPVTLLGVGSPTQSNDYPKTPTALSADIYVDPNASTNGDGSESSPFNNLPDALAEVADGQRVGVHAGTLSFTSRLTRSTAWATGIEIFALGTKRPVLDFSGLAQDDRGLFFNGSLREHWFRFRVIGPGMGSSTRQRAVTVAGDSELLHLEDFRVTDWTGEAFYGFQDRSGKHLVQDWLVYRSGAEDPNGVTTNAADHYVCTAPIGGIMGDTKFVRCGSVMAPDDAFDMFRGAGCETIECWSYRAGYMWDGTQTGKDVGADGTAFKLGGDSGTQNNAARGCLSIASRSQAIQANSAPGPLVFRFNGAYGGQSYGFNPYIVSGTEVFANLTNHTFGGDGHTGVSGTYNSWNDPADAGGNSDFPLAPAQLDLADPSAFDYSLGDASAARSAGPTNQHLGPSVTTLELAKRYLGHVVGPLEVQ